MYLIFPAGMTEFIDSRGVKHFPDSRGQVDAPASELGAFFSAGFVYPAVVEYAPDLAALHIPFLVAASQTTLTIKEGTTVKVINNGRHTLLRWDADTTFVIADYLDTGVIEAGKDYSVYALDFIPAGKTLPFLVSLNSTFPLGTSADNSRKVGGFHALCVAAGVITGHPLTGFAVAAILPASVWCLNHRPWCSPEGMVWSEAARVWVDIYLQSSTGATTASVYGATITDTRVWHDHVDDLAAVKKRLLSDDEFAAIAEGSNQKTNIFGSADPVTTGGKSDTATRRMLSNIGVEDACGAMWQWLRDQSWQFNRGAVAYVAASQTTIITHEAAPGGNPIYIKFGVDGTPYLCCNMGTAVDKVVTFGTNYKVIIKHDAGAATGLPLYFDHDATLPYRFLVNNTVHGKDAWALTNDPNYLLPLKHDASAATNGVAVNYDDGADNRPEYIGPTAANATMDLAMTHTEPAWGWQDLGSNKGSLYKQGSLGDAKLLAGGHWTAGSYCGSRCRSAHSYRWYTHASIGTRGCAEPR